MTDREIFQRNLNYYLSVNNKKQKDLADYVGAKTTTVSGWTRGISYPRADAMEKIAMFFGIPTSELVGERNAFQYRLQKSLANANMTISELSAKTEISEALISSYINGDNVPKQDRCYALAMALSVDPGWLMTGDEPVRHNYIHVVDENGERIIDVINDDRPQTREARIISGGIDKLPKEQREQALAVLQAVFAQYADYFKKGDDE